MNITRTIQEYNQQDAPQLGQLLSGCQEQESRRLASCNKILSLSCHSHVLKSPRCYGTCALNIVIINSALSYFIAVQIRC